MSVEGTALLDADLPDPNEGPGLFDEVVVELNKCGCTNRTVCFVILGFLALTLILLGTSIGMGLMVGALREKQWQLLQEIGIRQEAETALRESEERYRIQFERASEGITVISGLNENLEQRVNERTAQLEAANREMEAFSYSVSHDLRAPLRSIDGLSQALLEDCQDQLDAAGRQYLSRIRLGTQRMGELIEDLLELSKTGRAELRRVEVELSGLARSVVDELARANPDSGVEVSIQPELRARADQHLIRVVLENLLGNAWKFTSKRRDPRIEFGGSVAPGGERIFFIRDNGAGFDMAHADRLFNAFWLPISKAPASGSPSSSGSSTGTADGSGRKPSPARARPSSSPFPIQGARHEHGMESA